MMKIALLATLALCNLATAFPRLPLDRDLSSEEMERLSSIADRINANNDVKARRGLLSPGFNAEEQYISTAGEHQFQAPGHDDLRGPCPGLNAMANHGYLPHNGVATITQFIEATNKVFGMGLDLGAFLAVYGAVFDGDLTSWSIGGPPPPGVLGGLLSGVDLLGTPQGISYSHNKYESDVSPTRGDLYQYGDAYRLVMSQFEDLYSQPLGDRGYDLDTLTKFRAKRFQESIDENPYFFNGPFTGVAVQPAAYTFIYRFMANKSAEYPDGYLDGNVLKAFFSITGEPGSFEHTEGHERIPDNWYTRAQGDEYSIPYFQLDFLDAALKHPEFLNIGGNTGEVDTFAGVDLTDLTGGVYNSETLLEGNNLACFAYQAAQQAAPDILEGLFTSITKPMAKLTEALNKVMANLNCPQLEKFDSNQFDQFPGSKVA